MELERIILLSRPPNSYRYPEPEMLVPFSCYSCRYMAGAAPFRMAQTSLVVYKPPNYKVEELIGSGTFSEVFKATHKTSLTKMALKIFRYSMRTESNYRLAAKEIAFLEMLEHPNILQLILYEINQTYVYIGTEYAEFGSLRNYMRRKKPFSESIIRHIIKQLISALSYLHEMGLFHGDVKPENILCTKMTEEGPLLKIGDFGLSEIKLKGNNNMFFKSGSFLYMAPEVILKYPVDCTCDLWSAGIIMYIMMFARNIFRIPEKDREKQTQFIKRRLPLNWSGSENFTSECNDLVQCLLCYDKQNRIRGKQLRRHPFLNIPDPILPDPESFLKTAEENITTARTFANERKFGEALVQSTKAVMKLKIHYNLIDDVYKQKVLKRKWAEYQQFTSNMERRLAEPENLGLLPTNCSNMELRKHLASTPKLLDGFDIGCSAEMYLKEGNKSKALEMFHQALQTILPLMKTEPRSNRKEVLGRRLEKWIEMIEVLSGAKKQMSEDQAAVVAAHNAASASPANNAPISLPSQQ